MQRERKPHTPRRRYVRFTRWRRRRFFALLAESGNVRMAAELAGVGLGAIYRLRRREAGFSERMAAAVAEAGLRLGKNALHRPSDGPPPPEIRGRILASSSGAGLGGGFG